tara:strand:- start:655 stop:777 length:123 start_codon:yes stop_codon:yes gene_type:complete
MPSFLITFVQVSEVSFLKSRILNTLEKIIKRSKEKNLPPV